MIQVVTLTGTLSYAGKYGVSAMLCGNITDQLLNQYGLTYTRTAEKADLTTLLVGAEKVYSNNSVSVDCSSKSGAGLWIGS